MDFVPASRKISLFISPDILEQKSPRSWQGIPRRPKQTKKSPVRHQHRGLQQRDLAGRRQLRGEAVAAGGLAEGQAQGLAAAATWEGLGGQVFWFKHLVNSKTSVPKWLVPRDVHILYLTPKSQIEKIEFLDGDIQIEKCMIISNREQLPFFLPPSSLIISPLGEQHPETRSKMLSTAAEGTTGFLKEMPEKQTLKSISPTKKLFFSPKFPILNQSFCKQKMLWLYMTTSKQTSRARINLVYNLETNLPKFDIFGQINHKSSRR